MTRLLIIRHGNTFSADEEPRRVGVKTDIPLVQSGIDQARALGAYLKREGMLPDTIYASALQRAQETAQIMMRDSGRDQDVITDENFNEIDHGVDENKTEDEIIARLGKGILEEWNAFGVVPDGWNVDPRSIQQSWLDFANDCLDSRGGKTTCVVSSGGIIRFAPIVLNDAGLPDDQSPKVRTASMSLMEHDGRAWRCLFWNKRPE
ncbi:MAG: phosphoglycerate mutase [Alphaproteobacteria bacterium]|nr:MAG: phosphoglycerate mutase [Alphaproteobacteria bacterium]